MQILHIGFRPCLTGSRVVIIRLSNLRAPHMAFEWLQSGSTAVRFHIGLVAGIFRINARAGRLSQALLCTAKPHAHIKDQLDGTFGFRYCTQPDKSTSVAIRLRKLKVEAGWAP